MTLLLVLSGGALAGAALFWLVWRGLSRHKAGAFAMLAAVLVLPWIASFTLPASECSDYGCGFLVMMWLWRSVMLAIGAAIGVFASLVSPWGPE